MPDPAFDLLVQGFPGSSPSNGGMGWSSVGLVRVDDRLVLLDTGPFGARELVRTRLRALDVDTSEVTDVLVTHAHHDHCINWPMFPNARVHLSAIELDWAVEVPLGTSPVAEFSVRELARRDSTIRIDGEGQVLPGIIARSAAGHTPGSLAFEVAVPGATTFFAGDAVKNRAELLGNVAEATLDADASSQSIGAIREAWLACEGGVLVPGHDLPLIHDGSEVSEVGEREAAVIARFGDSLESVSRFELNISVSR
jgi:N-acyl homoserine lactone hydrolase